MQQSLILILSLFLAADAAAGRIIVRVPAGINLSEASVSEQLRGAAPTPSGRYDTFEIVIYYFSPGIETFSYGDDNTLSESMKKGAIRALIKCKKSNVLKKALFVEAEGTGAGQVLENFGRAVAAALRGL